ncbi:putative membrane protein, partial [Mycoplasmopsis fermentans MF-I2]
MHRKNPKSSAIALIVLSLLSTIIIGIAIFMYISVIVEYLKMEKMKTLKITEKKLLSLAALITLMLPISVASFALHIVITIQASKL